METKSPIDFSNISVTETMNNNLESLNIPINAKANIDLDDFFNTEIDLNNKNNGMDDSLTSTESIPKNTNIVEDVEDLTEFDNFSISSESQDIKESLATKDIIDQHQKIQQIIKKPEINQTLIVNQPLEIQTEIKQKPIVNKQPEIKPISKNQINHTIKKNTSVDSEMEVKQIINQKIIADHKPIINQKKESNPIIDQNTEIKPTFNKQSEVKQNTKQTEVKKTEVKQTEVKQNINKNPVINQQKEIKPIINQQKKKIIHKTSNEQDIQKTQSGNTNEIKDNINDDEQTIQKQSTNEVKDKQNINHNKIKIDYTYYAIYGFNISTTSVYLAIGFIIFAIIYFIYLYRSPNIIPMNRNLKNPNPTEKIYYKQNDSCLRTGSKPKNLISPTDKKKVTVSYEEQKKINKTTKQK